MATVLEAMAVAVQHHQAGRLEEAEDIYRRILVESPNEASVLHLLGVMYSQKGQHELAVECLRRAIGLKSTEAEFHSNLGKVLIAQGKFDEAAECCRRALELRPEFAEAQNNLGAVFRAGGKLDAAIICFQKALDLKPELAIAHKNLGEVMQAQGKRKQAIACFHQVVQLQPNDAEAHNLLGIALRQQGQLEEAAACFRWAVELRPADAEAHSNLGTVLVDQEKFDEAVACHRRALELRPEAAATYNNLANALKHQGKLDEAVSSYRQALKLNPHYADAYNNLGNAYKDQGKFEVAGDSYERALELNADHADAHGHRSLLRLLMGDFERGWAEYEWRWKTGKLIDRGFAQPRWRGEALDGKTILLHAEQGFGDTIQFVRYAAVVKKKNPAASVVVECQRPLVKLLTRCPGIDRLVAEGDELPGFDVHCPLLSLPSVLRTRMDTIPAEVPYLFADSALVEHWRERLSAVSGFRIGINWHGRGGQGEFRRRNIPPECFAKLAEIPGVRLISLQKDEQFKAQSSKFKIGEPSGGAIIELDDLDTAHGAFMDTAAIMMNLDLVITSDTSVPHLAGALGMPVWVALPFVPDWRWLLKRSDSPWYPTMRLFRQKRMGDWAGVFEQIEAELRERVHGSKFKVQSWEIGAV